MADEHTWGDWSVCSFPGNTVGLKLPEATVFALKLCAKPRPATITFEYLGVEGMHAPLYKIARNFGSTDEMML